MIFLKENINKIIFIVILILLFVIFYLNLSREKEYIKSFNDTKIIKIYTNKNAEKIYPRIENENDNDKIKKILNEYGIDKFILNNNGKITAGEHYNSDKYLVSIVMDNEIKDIVSIENESMYIYETDNTLIAAINKTMKDAEKDIAHYLTQEKLDERKTIYVIKENKNMTDKFKKYIK